MTKKISFEDACILNVVRVLRFSARLLPLSAVVAVGRTIGLVAYLVSKRRLVARRNLRAAFADRYEPKTIRRLARRSFQNLGASFGEMLKIPEMDARYIEQYLSIEGRETFERYASSGKGAIFLTAHFGSWELLNIAAAILGYPMTVLARVQKHPRSDEFLNNLRASKGATVVFKGMMLRQLVRALKSGGVVAMLIDQDGGRRGVFVNLLGRRSSTPAGAAQFALGTGAPVFCVFTRRVGALNHRIVVEGPLEKPSTDLDEASQQKFILQQFTDKLEAAIHEAPDQWLWAHRRWKSTPDRWVVLLSDGKAGHLKQSQAVVESIRHARIASGSPTDSLHVRTVELNWRSQRRLAILKAFGWLTGRTPLSFLRWALQPESSKELFSSYADIVVSCGSSLLDAHLWLKRENGARSVVIMKPHRALEEFEAVLAPRHDRIAARPNVFRTEGAVALLDPESIRLRAAELSAQLQLNLLESPIISLYLGGDTGKFHYEPEALQAFLTQARTTAERLRADLLVTTSRRTPPWAETMTQSILEPSPALRLLVLANRENRPGVVEGMIGVSGAHWVSGESISMLSEVLASGRPVWSFFPGDRSTIKKKYLVFLGRLAEEGKVRPWKGEMDSMKEEVGQAMQAAGAREEMAESTIPAEAIRRVLA